MTENVPVRWEEELARHAKDVAALERPSLGQISLRAGVMTYQGQPVPGNRLGCIVIASAFEHRWFKNKFNPDRRENPNCFALSLTNENMAPHADSPEKQADVCDECELFKWGSDPNGGKGKACKQVRRLALLPASVLKDGGAAKAEMALITIPVTSGRNWANYVNFVSAEYKRPPWAVITDISVLPNPKTQFEVKFTTGALVAEDMLADLMKRVEIAQSVLMTPYDYSGAEAEEEAPAKVSKAGKKY